MDRITIWTVMLCMWVFSSCEKSIDIELDDANPKLVVDASIENGQAPIVFLSKSLGYFNTISPDSLAASFVRDAVVVISDGTLRHQLRLDSITSQTGFKAYFYTNNPADPATAIFGRLKGSYLLEILVDGRQFTANTTIPDITRRIDSLWWEPVEAIEDTNKVKMIIKATDKPGFGDYIRYFTKTNSEPFFPGQNSVFDDQVIDGTTYTLPVDRGVNKNEPVDDEDLFFNRGDTVVLKLCNIDRNTYDFWRTLEFSFQSIGNPFSSPTRILGNVSGEALGYFGGYAAQYRTLLIPPR